MTYLRKDDLKAHGYSYAGSNKNRRIALMCAIDWYNDPIPVLRLLYKLLSLNRSDSIYNKLNMDIMFIHKICKIPFPLDIKDPYSTEYLGRGIAPLTPCQS